MSFLNRYLELLLTFAGLLICMLLIHLIPGDGAHKWQMITIVALVIGAIHGVIFFLVRNRERKARAKLIKEATHMLQDRLNNLMFIIVNGSNSGDPELEKQSRESIDEIQRILGALSLSSIQKWKDYYGYK